MKAQDYMNQDNNRAEVVNKLIEICTYLSLSYEFTEKKFKIDLPQVEDLPVTNQVTKKRQTFDISKWGEPGPIEGLPEELPPAEYKLEEGEPPKEPEE